MKRIIAFTVAALLLLAGCAGGGEPVNAFTREEGSGTRGAFVEILGIDADGTDMTSAEIPVANGTDIVMTSVAGDINAIGYISMGSVNDTVKAISIDGVEPTAENVQAGTYPISRPFNIATKGTPSELAQDFINFAMSDEGQALAVEEGYIAVPTIGAYTASGEMSGTLSVGGSTSVGPLMEVMAEAYKAINPDVSIDIQQTGSTAGMTGAIDGTLDIGMASRGLKEAELAELTPVVIATDGIAVIVNNDSAVTNLTQDQVKSIYVGDVTSWSELQG